MAPLESKSPPPAPFSQPRFLLAVFAISFCMLFLELLYPKFFYFLKIYPGFEMVLVAVNMLGLAAGGIYGYLWPRSALATRLFALLFALSIGLSLVTTLYGQDPRWIIAVLVLPFFFGSAVIAEAFIAAPPSRVYAASLLGSGLGILAIFFLLEPLGGEGCILLVTALAAVAAVSLPGRPLIRTLAGLWIIIFAALFTVPALTDRLDLIKILPRTYQYPGLTAQVGSDALKLSGAKLLSTRWSLITRVDAIQGDYSMMTACFPEGLPETESPGLRELRETYLTPINLYYNNEAFTPAAAKGEIFSTLPYLFLDRPSVLVIGPGGGTDLAKAYFHQAKEVVAVEINPGTVEMMRGPLAQASGQVYNRAEVHTLDGRTYVHWAGRQFDLITLMFAELYIAFPNSQVFIENYLYTVEAFEDYFRHLNDQGFIFISKPLAMKKGEPSQLLRLTTTAYEALRRLGVERPQDHIVVFGMRCALPFFEGGHLLIKRTPFSAEEVARIAALQTDPFYMLAGPGLAVSPPDDPFRQFLESPDKKSFYDSYPLDVTPCTDNRPFFYIFDRDLPVHRRFYSTFLKLASILNLIPLALIFLLSKKFLRPAYYPPLLFFLALGAAYMFLQAAMIQKFNLYLGSPTYSLAVVIGSFMVFAGLGSGLAGRLSPRGAIVGVILIPLLLLGTFLLLPRYLELTFSPHLGSRIAAALLFLAPLSFCLGLPFPRALAGVKARFSERDAALFYSVDAAVAVIAVVSSILLSILFGFNALFLLTLAGYALAALIFIFTPALNYQN